MGDPSTSSEAEREPPAAQARCAEASFSSEAPSPASNLRTSYRSIALRSAALPSAKKTVRLPLLLQYCKVKTQGKAPSTAPNLRTSQRAMGLPQRRPAVQRIYVYVVPLDSKHLTDTIHAGIYNQQLERQVYNQCGPVEGV